MYTRLRMLTESPEFENPVLVYGFTGFLEAGAAVRLATDHILASVEHQLVAEFDIDALFDYRARRPRLRFASDHYSELDLPSLQISACRDERGAGFFVMHGVEPDFGWRSIVADVATFIAEQGISRTVGMLAVPFPAPHTRPIAVTTHANQPELLVGRRSWVGEMEVPGSLSGVLEYSLGERDIPAMGFAAHVPHYLANLMHPASALALIKEVSLSTGLLIPTDALRVAAEQADADLNEQLQQSTDNLEAVQQLEAQFDALVAERAEEVGSAGPESDTIAAQVEQFLTQMDSRGKAED